MPMLRLAGWLFAFIVAAWIVLMIPILSAARLPPGESGKMLVAFWPGADHDEVFRNIVDAGGLPIRPVGSTSSLWVVEASNPGFVAAIEDKGAFGAYRDLPASVVLAGCSGISAPRSIPAAVVDP